MPKSPSTSTTPLQGLNCILSILQCVVSMVLLGASLGTRGWLTWTGEGPETPYGGFMKVGLFTTEISGRIEDTKDILINDYDGIRKTIILECVGGILLLVATFFLLISAFVYGHINCILAFCISAFVSGAIQVAGPVNIQSTFADVNRFDVAFGWWFALFSAIFTFGSVATFGYSVRRRPYQIQAVYTELR